MSATAIDTVPHIAFMGKAGAGKSTALERLMYINSRYVHGSFAAQLRSVVVSLWGEEARNDREKLQRVGLALREIDPDVWARALMTKMDGLLEERPEWRIAIDDLRFENEYIALRKRGFVTVRIETDRSVRVDRLKRNGKLQDEAQLEHVSETALDHIDADYFWENDDMTTMDELDRFLADVLYQEARRV